MSRADLSDKRRNLEVPTGYFAQKIYDRMLELSTPGDTWDTRKLSEKLDLNYEYLRKIVRGEALPSKQLMLLIIHELKLDKEEAEILYVCDKIRQDYGTLPLKIAGKNPELDVFERLWGHCSKEHQDRLVSLLKEYASKDSVEGK